MTNFQMMRGVLKLVFGVYLDIEIYWLTKRMYFGWKLMHLTRRKLISFSALSHHAHFQTIYKPVPVYSKQKAVDLPLW